MGEGVRKGGRETHFFQQGSRVSLFINRPSFFLRIWSYVQQGARGWVAQAESTTIVSPAIKNMRCPLKFLTLLSNCPCHIMRGTINIYCAMAPCTVRTEVARFIAETAPALRLHYDCFCIDRARLAPGPESRVTQTHTCNILIF